MVTVALSQNLLPLHNFVVETRPVEASRARAREAFNAMLDSGDEWMLYPCCDVRLVTASEFKANYLSDIRDPMFVAAIMNALDQYFKTGVVTLCLRLPVAGVTGCIACAVQLKLGCLRGPGCGGQSRAMLRAKAWY